MMFLSSQKECEQFAFSTLCVFFKSFPPNTYTHACLCTLTERSQDVEVRRAVSEKTQKPKEVFLRHSLPAHTRVLLGGQQFTWIRGVGRSASFRIDLVMPLHDSKCAYHREFYCYFAPNQTFISNWNTCWTLVTLRAVNLVRKVPKFDENPQ